MPEIKGDIFRPTKKSMEKEVHISKKEEEDRLEDLEKAIHIYGNIRSKASKLLPMLEEVAKEIAHFQQHCQQTPALRALYLDKKLASDPMMRTILGTRNQVTQLIKISERAEQSISGIENEIVNPSLLR